MKNILKLIIVTIFLVNLTKSVNAQTHVAGATASLAIHESVSDPRITKLENYLMFKNPELSLSADTFVHEADRLNLDWKLVAAISGLESSFCKAIPTNSYNCWGWGIPTGASDGIHFRSFSDGIAKVSEGLRFRYYDRGLITVDEIGRTYAASPTWAVRVKYIMNQIDNWEIASVKIPQVTL